MHNILANARSVKYYIDDIVINSATEVDHIIHFEDWLCLAVEEIGSSFDET